MLLGPSFAPLSRPIWHFFGVAKPWVSSLTSRRPDVSLFQRLGRWPTIVSTTIYQQKRNIHIYIKFACSSNNSRHTYCALTRWFILISNWCDLRTTSVTLQYDCIVFTTESTTGVLHSELIGMLMARGAKYSYVALLRSPWAGHHSPSPLENVRAQIRKTH